jgi:hypothetical protein
MNVNRVTLSAFGTTGVLLAASLTMLAMVSALVTFNAWPTRGGAAAANSVSIQHTPAARVVRAVRPSSASIAAAAARRAAAAASGSGLSGGSGGGAGGPGGAGGGPGGSGGPGGPGQVPSGPSPQVPHSPPGEGDPVVVPSRPGPGPSSPATIVHTTVCGAVSGVGAAGGAAGC